MKNKKILIVEDEILIAYQIVSLLKQNGYYDVDMAHSKQAAIEYSITRRPKIIFMDIAMEYKTAGIDACVEIKKILGNHVKIFFLTSYSPVSFEEQLQGINYDGFIDKLRFSVDFHQILEKKGFSD